VKYLYAHTIGTWPELKFDDMDEARRRVESYAQERRDGLQAAVMSLNGDAVVALRDERDALRKQVADLEVKAASGERVIRVEDASDELETVVGADWQPIAAVAYMGDTVKLVFLDTHNRNFDWHTLIPVRPKRKTDAELQREREIEAGAKALQARNEALRAAQGEPICFDELSEAVQRSLLDSAAVVIEAIDKIRGESK
jgi:hypothetical protein